MEKHFFFSILLIFLIVSLAMTYSNFCALQELWLDDFASYNARWNWGYNAGTGYKTLTTIDGYSVCEGGITNESTSSVYSDCSLHHFIDVGDDEPIRVEIRMRYTDRNGLVDGDQGKGTKGCGWWDGTTWGDNVAWFASFSPDNFESVVGFRCQVRRAGIWYLNEDVSGVVDMMEWHVYRIDMLLDGTFFYVDDELVASTPYRPQSIVKLEAGWVDNAYFYYSNGSLYRGFLDLDIDQKMYIDWVKLSIPPAQDTTPPTTIHDYDGLWHNIDFTITVTATDDLSGVAETYYKINYGPAKNVSIDGQPIITNESANNTLEYWSVDNADNEELPHKILTEIKLDKTTPTGSIAINNNDAYTNSTSVTLNLTAIDATSGAYQSRFSSDGVWDTEPWEALTMTKEWTLPSGDGIKTVYYQIKDEAGLVSITYSDTIILDTTPPTIGIPIRIPDGDVLPGQAVKVSVNVTDVTSEVKNVTLYYTLDNGTTWEEPIPMNYTDSIDLYETTIPPQQAETWVKYKIVAYDKAKNPATKDGTESYCIYQVIPEFPTLTSILLILMELTAAVAIYKRRLLKTAHA